MHCDMVDHESMRPCFNWLVSPTDVLFTCFCISAQVLSSIGLRPGLLDGRRSGEISYWRDCFHMHDVQMRCLAAMDHFHRCISDAN